MNCSVTFPGLESEAEWPGSSILLLLNTGVTFAFFQPSGTSPASLWFQQFSQHLWVHISIRAHGPVDMKFNYMVSTQSSQAKETSFLQTSSPISRLRQQQDHIFPCIYFDWDVFEEVLVVTLDILSQI